MNKVTLAATMALITLPVAAENIANVDVAEQIQLQEQTYQLNGAGVRSKFFIDLYVGSLYLPQPQHQLEQVLAQPEAVIRLNITSGLITADKMHDAVSEGFELATNQDTSAIDEQISAFMALFKDEIKQGDQFTFVTKKDHGVISYKNGQRQGEVSGEAFRQALVKIWLGDKPAQTSLKQAMLNQK